jgi:hypothetical protein
LVHADELVRPTTVENVPAEHARHSDELERPSPDEYEPATQALHGAPAPDE